MSSPPSPVTDLSLELEIDEIFDQLSLALSRHGHLPPVGEVTAQTLFDGWVTLHCPALTRSSTRFTLPHLQTLVKGLDLVLPKDEAVLLFSRVSAAADPLHALLGQCLLAWDRVVAADMACSVRREALVPDMTRDEREMAATLLARVRASLKDRPRSSPCDWKGFKAMVLSVMTGVEDFGKAEVFALWRRLPRDDRARVRIWDDLEELCERQLALARPPAVPADATVAGLLERKVDRGLLQDFLEDQDLDERDADEGDRKKLAAFLGSAPPVQPVGRRAPNLAEFVRSESDRGYAQLLGHVSPLLAAFSREELFLAFAAHAELGGLLVTYHNAALAFRDLKISLSDREVVQLIRDGGHDKTGAGTVRYGFFLDSLLRAAAAPEAEAEARGGPPSAVEQEEERAIFKVFRDRLARSLKADAGPVQSLFKNYTAYIERGGEPLVSVGALHRMIADAFPQQQQQEFPSISIPDTRNLAIHFHALAGDQIDLATFIRKLFELSVSS
jgi:hypothetical protein